MTRRSTVFTLIAAFTLLVSCKKSGTDKEEVNEENSFTIDGTTYKADDVFFNEDLNSIKAQKVTPGSGLNQVQSLTIKFNENYPLPTTGGSFDVVDDPSEDENGNLVSIRAIMFPYDNGTTVDDKLFKPAISPVQKVSVTVDDNKINIKFSNLSFTSQTGNSTISANIAYNFDR